MEILGRVAPSRERVKQMKRVSLTRNYLKILAKLASFNVERLISY